MTVSLFPRPALPLPGLSLLLLPLLPLLLLLLSSAAAPLRASPSVTHAAAAPPPADDIGWDLALDRSVPGKGGWTTCYQYASGLQQRFTRAGGESHVVIYNWSTPDAGTRGCHAFLVYRDAAGQYWGTDNLSAQPRWLRGTTPPEWASFWDGDKTVRVLADFTDRKLKGRWANLAPAKTI